MGFFSQDCASCGHPALSSMATTEVNAWMSQVVAISPPNEFAGRPLQGEVHIGEYDGYGRVGGAEYAVGESATVWHVACWELAMKPMGWQGASRRSADQGWFFEEGAHDLPDPRIAGRPHLYAGPTRHSIIGDR
jgi:hypothetical protein